MGITYFGRGRIRFQQGGEDPDVYVENQPGTVYLGQLTGAEHQAYHKPTEDFEYINLPGLGLCSMSVMLRTSLFPYARSRLRNTTPSPPELFYGLAGVFCDSFSRHTLCLPSLSDCMTGLVADESLRASSGHEAAASSS
jgi:hypothetical protein